MSKIILRLFHYDSFNKEMEEFEKQGYAVFLEANNYKETLGGVLIQLCKEERDARTA